jgi:twitching motility protein PilT
MIVTPAISKLIEQGEDARILDVVKSSREDGMMDFNHSLYGLIQEGYIDREIALAHSPNPQALEANLQGVFVTTGALR